MREPSLEPDIELDDAHGIAGRNRRHRIAVWVALVVMAIALGIGAPAWNRALAAARYPVTADDITHARIALASMPVRGQAPMTGYDRARFGPEWADVDHNGCDTRNDVLARDLTAAKTTETDGCIVLRGTLDDPYTGTVHEFTRGEHSASVQIDHIVALADAWQTGAQSWPSDVRTAFANDPANLIAVDGAANQDKGAGDASAWLPPNAPYRCVYVLRQVDVKSAYGLWITSSERDAIDREIDRCVVVPKPVRS